MTRLLILIFSIFFVNNAYCETLELISDDELQKLIKQEQYVVALFVVSKHQEASDNLEIELAAVREDFVDSFNAWVVKLIDSELRSMYSPKAEPAIVFFRSTIPVLYTGAADEDELLETLTFQKDAPCVTALSDASFEHLTQVSTGATTGDWFIEFNQASDVCPECRDMNARIEALACRFKTRVNVARINKDTTGAVTARRFGVTTVPSYILFRLGKMYKYELQVYDVESMASFITTWHKNVQAERIPLPKSPFDDLTTMCANYLRDYPIHFGVGGSVLVLMVIMFVYLLGSDPSQSHSSKKRKTKKSDKKKKDN